LPPPCHDRQLLYRAEAGASLRLTLAALGGRLADAAPCANPHAPLFYGMSGTFRRGHGAGADLEEGSGAAVSWARGPVTAALGHFCRPAGSGKGVGAPRGARMGGAPFRALRNPRRLTRPGHALSLSPVFIKPCRIL
jgi:hypothetical protein